MLTEYALLLATICLTFRANGQYPMRDLSLGDDFYAADEQYSETVYSMLTENVTTKLGMISGVAAINSSHIYVFHRASRKWDFDTFDANNNFKQKELGPIKENTIALLVDGNIKLEGGAGLFFMPHSVTVDREGNVWTTDVGLHQVFKFKKDDLTKPVLILGERFIPGSEPTQFCKPTDVKVAQDGSFFVSDGYCNSRVKKYHANGTVATIFDDLGILIPHALALSDETGMLYVADREGQRVVALNVSPGDELFGQMEYQVDMDGRVFGIDFHSKTNQLAVLLQNEEKSFVRLVDINLESQQYILGPNEEGFADGHALSTFDLPVDSSYSIGIAVCSLTNPVPIENVTHPTGQLFIIESVA